MQKSEKYFMKLVSFTERRNRAFCFSVVAFDVSILGAQVDDHSKLPIYG